MKLAVRHTTYFSYDSVINYSVQRVHLTPLSFVGQTVLNWKITAPGIDSALVYTDGFGNCIHLLTANNIDGEMQITAEGLVERSNTNGLVQGVSTSVPNAVFLRQTPSTLPSAEISDMVARAIHFDLPVLDQLHALMQGVHQNVSFVIGATDAETTAQTAFANGRGVCQDHSHIMIGAARALGIASRYVTGYLVTGVGASSTAAHAWAECFIPELGWVGFDPANGICPTDHYVRVAAGIDAASVTPIRGSRRGGAHETMRVEVSVEIAQQ
jgi:transglutaminase-like putative cysteine protease